MQVTNVRVSFLREKQPAQYEKAAPAVEFAAVLDQGDDHVAAARRLMIDATAVVYAGIGYGVPAKVAKALADGYMPAEVSVEAITADVAPAAPEAGGVDVPGEEAKPKTRGRPKGSKNTRPKAGTKAAEEALKGSNSFTGAKPFPDDDTIPGDDAVPGDTPAISTGESRVGPDDNPEDHGIPGDSDGIPGDEDTASKEEVEFTAKDLHTLIHESIKAKKLSVPSAKQVLAQFKVARAQDLTPEQVIEGRGMVEKMIAASGT